MKKYNLIYALSFTLLAAVFIVLFLAATGNSLEKYYDIVIEKLAFYAGNKSNEISMVYYGIFAGIISYSFFYFFLRFKSKNYNEILELNYERESDISGIAIVIFGTIFLYQAVIMQKISCVLLFALLLGFICTILKKSDIDSAILLYFAFFYFLLSIYRVYVFLAGEVNINTIVPALISFLLLLLLLISKLDRYFNRIMLSVQIGIPLLLLIFLQNRYVYNGVTVSIYTSFISTFSVMIIMLLMIVFNFLKAYKYWNYKGTIGNVIYFTSCAAVMIFNRYTGQGAIITTDDHHPYENIIGFSQIFELGQVPFKNYIPISGMYSIIHGAFFKFFGNGEMGLYNVADNIFYFFIIILIAALLYKRVSGKLLFIISLLFVAYDYDRIVYILPIILLLSDERLIKKANLWLVFWFLTSLFHGLYYPVYGASVALAFLPLGIYQIYILFKTKEINILIKKPLFWLEWLFCLVILILSSNFLIGTLKHILVLGKQTILADGFPRFAQKAPDFFLPYLSESSFFRLSILQVFSFLPLMIISVMGFILFINIAVRGKLDSKELAKNVPIAVLFLIPVIAPMIAYTSTLVRLDYGYMYARSAGVIYASTIIFIILVNRYIKNKKIGLALIIIATLIFTIGNNVGFLSLDKQLESKYIVPDNYLLVENDQVEKLGTGFVEANAYKLITDNYNAFKDRDKNLSYIGNPIYFGYYYLCNIKGDGPMEVINTPKSYEVVSETIDNARRNNSIMGSLYYPDQTYYLYNYLVTSGDYVWDNINRQFLPNDNNYTKEEIIELNRSVDISWDDYYCGAHPSVLGESIEDLMNNMSQVDIGYSISKDAGSIKINFNSTIEGEDADFLYIDIETNEDNYVYKLTTNDSEEIVEPGLLSKYLMRKHYNYGSFVKVYWYDNNLNEHSLFCDLGKGRLLIPMGAGLQWLLNSHDNIKLEIISEDNFEIKIADVKFLKSKAIE